MIVIIGGEAKTNGEASAERKKTTSSKSIPIRSENGVNKHQRHDTKTRASAATTTTAASAAAAAAAAATTTTASSTRHKANKTIHDCIDIDGLTRIEDRTCRKIIEREELLRVSSVRSCTRCIVYLYTYIFIIGCCLLI